MYVMYVYVLYIYRDELSPMDFASHFLNGRASLEMERVGATIGSLIIISTEIITVPVSWF